MFNKGDFVYFNKGTDTENDVTYKGIVTVLTDKTFNKPVINKDELKKAGSYLINTSIKKMIDDARNTDLQTKTRKVVLVVGGRNNEGKIIDLSELSGVKDDNTLTDDELVNSAIKIINDEHFNDCHSIEQAW